MTLLVKKCQGDAHFKVARHPNVWQRIEKRGLEIEKTELVCSLIKIEAWLLYFLYTKSVHCLHNTAPVYIFSVPQT